MTRAVLAPHYIPIHAFSGAPSNNMVVAQPQMQQNNPFNFAPYTGAGQNGIIPAFANNYIQPRPLPRLAQPEISYTRNTRQGFIEEHHSQSPPIKSEPHWNGTVNSPTFPSANATTTPTAGSNEVNFGTEVDTLMKAIQAKTQTTATTPTPQKPSSADQSRPVVGVSRTPPYVQASSQARVYGSGDPSQYKLTQKDVQEESSPKGGKKRYQCTIENCTKSFYQKTHLDIHERAHTGVKPYVSNTHFLLHNLVTNTLVQPCKEPGCGRSFSQLGNLKVSEYSNSSTESRLTLNSRHTSDGIPENVHTTAKSVAKDSPNAATCAPTRSFMISPSPISVDSTTAASNSRS